MATAKLPKNLNLALPAYGTVEFHGVPMFRALAWALWDYEVHDGHLTVSSGDRRYGVAEKYGHQSQKALYDGWLARKPGYLPANPPGFSSHELRSDGAAAYGVSRGGVISPYMLGIDAEYPGTGDATRVVAWLNAHGYDARKIYSTASEAHHFSFFKSPAANARKRLAKYKVTGK